MKERFRVLSGRKPSPAEPVEVDIPEAEILQAELRLLRGSAAAFSGWLESLAIERARAVDDLFRDPIEATKRIALIDSWIASGVAARACFKAQITALDARYKTRLARDSDARRNLE